MTFVARTLVRFAHVDAAGIVFYPRYFEMINAALEDFFADAIGLDFRTMHTEQGLGVPTVKLESEFVSPSRLGDMLDIAVTVERCGGTSAALCFDITCEGQRRLTVRSIIVCMSLTAGRSTRWPQAIRERLVPQRALAEALGEGA